MPGNALIIPDVQEPFGAEDAIAFCKAVKREFKVEDDDVYNAGDEGDLYFGSSHPKSPEAWLTPTGEIKALRTKIQLWARAFPKKKIAISNHMLRWIRKAFDAQLPSELLRSYQEVIGAPAGWKWQMEWVVKGRQPWRLVHGMGYSGKDGHRNATIDAGMSTAIGHLHAHAGICHLKTNHKRIWGMNVGCLIDEEAFAFEYNRYDRNKPILGCGVVIDGGLTPIFIPYERF